ncbi:putative translation factor [Heterostelium album PN500]|uniref:Protein pelota homolog n=1 Tax=Heterostelium pallidum (strain ATCC 26659 / Pp 5 / PN500) TaxID=670386 RepID=D3AX31_HETP5|nr:putative translation factor [Heterostelium album PN500]EFA86854.1 putative translation factor [Heterostelium album PN500]|eukprot:XP_020438957.1 putative translation factor [Heterostelium album PN500]
MSGLVKLHIEEEEDFWNIYNLVAVGDRLTSTTIRKVQKETATGSVSSERQRITITISVEKIDYETTSNLLRISGPVCEENRVVKMGAYHTIDLEMNRDFTLFKDEWDTVSLELVKNASDITQRADVAALIMNEGLANLCLITSSMTVVKGRIDVPVPRKGRSSSDNHQKGLENFFNLILQSIMRNINFEVVKCFIIASPAFVKDKFYQYMIEQSTKNEMYKDIKLNKSKFILAHSSSGHRYSLKEVLSEPTVQNQLTNTKAASEIKVLNSFYDMLKKDPNRAFYGFDHVKKANDRLAIETLLVTDDFFRGKDVRTRRKYVDLVQSVKENNGEVKIFSGLHVTGEQLSKLSGVAAILRCPMELEDEEEEYNEEEEEAANKCKGNNILRREKNQIWSLHNWEETFCVVKLLYYFDDSIKIVFDDEIKGCRMINHDSKSGSSNSINWRNF